MSKTHEPLTIYTIGHSTHSLDEFIHILSSHGVRKIIDVRTIPKSRHNPQFNKESLASGLGKIKYEHMPGLGGLRHVKKDSPNTGWQNASFRGYADYMLTNDFSRYLEKLVTKASKIKIAIMCAEALPWRCHRSLIADALTIQGVTVMHIFSATNAKPHTLTSFAVVEGDKIFYPAKPAQD